METPFHPKPHTEYLHYQLLTSSEVELMETAYSELAALIWDRLLTSSEVELMETVIGA